MLCMNNYAQVYIDDCRAKVDDQVAAYKKVVSAASGGSKKLESAIEAFEPVFFNNLVLVLENYFVHRTRGIEGKNGNALNEVRLLCTSMMSNGGRLVADKQIKLDPGKSVLGYAVDDEIALTEDDFARLSKAFFAEIESRFGEAAS